jgi:uncharacterized protein involved in exopolysaccharide biosynthesis
VKQLLVLLTAARDDDTRLVALPGRLLASHDTLRRLIEGLGTARLRTSNLLGSKSNDHPLVRAAKAEEVEVLADLRSELDGAIEIAAVEAMLRDREVKALRAQLAETQGRLTRLAGLRARYENLVVLAAGDAKLVEGVRRQLAEARASAAAGDAGLIARIDTPDAGTRPVGPSRSMIVAAGFGGGLLTGLAILFITVPSPGHVVAYSLAWQATGWSADSPRRIAELAGSWQSTQRSGSVESLLNAGRSSGLSFKEALQKGEPLRRAVA